MASSTNLTLHGFAKSENRPSPSGYCQKLETYLRAAGSPSYTMKATLPFSAPKGKLPYITFPDGSILADSHFILRHLLQNGLAPDLDADLSPAQRAESRAWAAWTEERLYPAVVSTRWLRDDNFVNARASLDAPFPINYALAWYLRRRIRTSLVGHGIGRHTDEEVDVFLREYVEALDARLSVHERGFFHGGDAPTTVDVIVWAFLANSLNGVDKSNPEFKEMVLDTARLREYVSLLGRRWFPEYVELLALVEGITASKAV